MNARPKIIRLWGKADSFDVEFTYKGGTLWQCDVPSDTEDGQYACEFWALNEQLEQAHWTGFLYVCNGVCDVIFNQPLFEIKFEKGCSHHV